MTNNYETDIPKITQDVAELLSQDTSGHGMDHVDRVLDMAITFAERENADSNLVTLAVLLHDVDDYKLVGKENADKLLHARRILAKYAVGTEAEEQVLEIISTMGYNKYLEQIRPRTLEGMIVSDADMCDAIGANGILRTHAYALSKGNEFFDKTVHPVDTSASADQYRQSKKSHSVQHFFDKLLIIPSILMTESGREEGDKRKAVMINFLRELFEEENAQVWQEYLKAFEEDSK